MKKGACNTTPMRVLGIETSCDETGVALYCTARGLLGQASVLGAGVGLGVAAGVVAGGLLLDTAEDWLGGDL